MLQSFQIVPAVTKSHNPRLPMLRSRKNVQNNQVRLQWMNSLFDLGFRRIKVRQVRMNYYLNKRNPSIIQFKFIFCY